MFLAFLLCPHQGKSFPPGSECFQSHHQPALPSGLPLCASAGCISQELGFENRSIRETGVWLNHFCVLSSPKQCSRGILLFQVSKCQGRILFVCQSPICYQQLHFLPQLTWVGRAQKLGCLCFAFLFNHISRFPFLASPPAH